MNISKISKTLLFSLSLFPITIKTPLPPPTVIPTPDSSVIQFKPNPQVLGKIKINVGKRAWLNDATVAKVEGTTITVAKDNAVYTVLTDAGTIFRRRFGGKSSLAEISPNDKLDILGKWNNEEKTEIKASRIRNHSIQKRFAVFFGEVKSINGETVIVSTARRGDQTIVADDSTRIFNRKMETIEISDIKIGHLIRIKGTWDSVSKIVTEVIQIKDFTIPLIEQGPAPTPTAAE